MSTYLYISLFDLNSHECFDSLNANYKYLFSTNFIQLSSSLQVIVIFVFQMLVEYVICWSILRQTV